MPHASNIKELKKAFSCGSNLVESYCRLIAIELQLYDIEPLKSHHIINKLHNLYNQCAGRPQAAALNTRIAELKHAFREIHVEARHGTCKLPFGSYPTIRYVRLQGDWLSSCTEERKLSKLNEIAKQTIATLRTLDNKI